MAFFALRALTEPGRFLLVPVMANGQPAFAVYERDSEGSYQAYSVTVPEATATGIAGIVTFFDPGLFGPFGLPREHDSAAGPGPGPRSAHPV